MATTYGYGGEFSSDEDIDRMEQQSERLIQSKFDSYAQVKPTKLQIEEAIEAIRLLPIDQDVNIKDELLAALLDHYKTKRGPIVDSTRNLYKRIMLRLVRGEPVHHATDNGDFIKGSNGTNNNVPAVARPIQAPETVSSDEDEPMPPVSSQSSVEQATKSKFDSRVVYDNKLEPMEVDSETPTARELGIRTVKQIDSSSSDDSDSETESSTDESDSEVLDVTPTKPTQVVPQKARNTGVTTTAPKAAKPIELPKKQAPVVKSSLDVEKPYTRSRRVATRASSSSTGKDDKKADTSSSKENPTAKAGVKPLGKSVLTSKLKGGILILAVLIVAILVLYNFRSDLNKLTGRILNRAIKF